MTRKMIAGSSAESRDEVYPVICTPDSHKIIVYDVGTDALLWINCFMPPPVAGKRRRRSRRTLASGRSK